MKFCFQVILSILICSVSLACDATSVIPDAENGDVEEIIPSGDERYLEGESEYIFNQDLLHTFELTIPPGNLAVIDADPSAEQYVEARLTFEGESIAAVGVRYKGSIGAFVGCVSGSDWSNPSGHKTCTKLSMKVKINWEGSGRRFYGLKKLQFHSQNLDDSQMHDRLGYWMFREMGILAPRSVHARLIINGQYSGLYSLIEQIDGQFTKENFTDGSGNLYKEIWPLGSNGFAHSDQIFLDHLRTNEEENPSAEMIRDFGEEVESSTSESIQEIVSRWMDLDQTIAYAAVDRAIRADDGPFHWYCGNGASCSNHNYYWYEEPTERKLYLIPWDLDNAFENLLTDVNPVTPIADEWGETRDYCLPFSYGQFGLRQRSAACDKLTAGWASYELKYKEALRRLLAGPYSEAMISSRLDAWTAQIRDASMEADGIHEDALSMARWSTAVADLRSALASNRSALLARSE